MPSIGFEMDDNTLTRFRQLREVFGVSTDAAVLKKAMALAAIMGEFADADHKVTLVPSDGKPDVKIRLIG
jgi:hypothetical protein